MLRYLSVCSGIEAATTAWEPLGWEPAGFAEIEPFPCAVLAHHYPHVRNFGDFTAIEGADVGAIDLLVGGTPCQSFSVAGLRGGLGDDRGNLALEFLRLAQRTRPKWVVWENVPGVLSSVSHAAPDPCSPPPPVDLECDGAEVETEDEYVSEELHAFYCFLAGLSNVGYGFAYRVLDAQYFGLAQRRKRVFVIGCLGNWRPAAAVLFERESLSGHPAPRREKGKDVAPTISARTKGGGGLETDFDCDGGLIAGIAGTLNTANGKARPGDTLQCAMAGHVLAFGGNNASGAIDIATACNTRSGNRFDFESETLITHTLRGEGFDASEDGTGRGVPLVATPIQSVQSVREKHQNGIGIGQAGDAMFTPTARDRHAIAFDCKAGANTGFAIGDSAGALRGDGHGGGHAAVAVSLRGRDGGMAAEISGEQVSALRASQGGGDKAFALADRVVRRLTPRECERLMGFPDDYTLVPYRSRPAADGPRYKALGNSMAVPVMRWIGRRINEVSAVYARWES